MNPQNSQEADTAQNLKKKNYTKGEKLGLCLTYTFSFEKKKNKNNNKTQQNTKAHLCFKHKTFTVPKYSFI